MICQLCKRECKNNRSLLSHLCQFHKEETTTKQYYDQYIKKSELEGKCKLQGCNNDTNFKSLKLGYHNYCCPSHANLDPATKIKKENTYFEKTGYIYNMKNPECLEKYNQTCLEKYGVKWTTQSKQVIEKNKLIWKNRDQKIIEEMTNKKRQTCLERYGIDNPFKNKELIKNSIIEKYGVDNPLKCEEIREKQKNTVKNKSVEEKQEIVNKRTETVIKKNIKKLLSILPKEYTFLKYDRINRDGHKLICSEKHEFNIQHQMLLRRIRKKHVLCNICNPYQIYDGEQREVLEFITQNYNGKIIFNERSVLEDYEIDIYLPELKLGFEFNGLFWHSDLRCNQSYHIDKTKKAESIGIHLIHIFEDSWIYKREIIESRILNLLGKSNRIYARECEIKEVNVKDSTSFLNDSHIQGNSVSKVRLGLFKDSELVSIMTFSGLRRNLGYKYKKEDEYELLRFCNKLNYTVIGGANKLFSYFLKRYNPKTIISYADRCWSTKLQRNIYDKLGFIFEKETELNYWYVIDGVRENRFGYCKSELIKQGFNKNKTEFEIMDEREIWRIYDCGSFKYVYNNIKYIEKENNLNKFIN